jgi:hypothetical protein
MEERESDYICTVIRYEDVEMGCHIDPMTKNYIHETVYLAIYDETEHAIDIAYGAEEIYDMVRDYAPTNYYYKDIHLCMMEGHDWGWV